jgi:hypothetical protein
MRHSVTVRASRLVESSEPSDRSVDGRVDANTSALSKACKPHLEQQQHLLLAYELTAAIGKEELQ